jgi:hypothetical protein
MVKSSTKPDAWTLSPQMTAAPGLWRDYEIVVPFWEPNLPSNALSPGGQFLLEVESGSPEMSLTTEGRSLVLPSVSISNTAIESPDGAAPDLSSSESYVLTLYMTIGDASVAGSGFNHRWEWEDVDTNEGFSGAVDTDGTFFIFTSGENTQGVGSIPIDDDQPHLIVVEWDQPNGTMTQFIDGLQDYSVSYSDTSSGTNMRLVFGLHSSNGGGDLARTRYHFFSIRKGRVNPSSTLLNDPFAMLRPAGF